MHGNEFFDELAEFIWGLVGDVVDTVMERRARESR